MLNITNAETAKSKVTAAKIAFRAAILQASATMQTAIAQALKGLSPEEIEEVHPASDRDGVASAVEAIQKAASPGAAPKTRASRG